MCACFYIENSCIKFSSSHYSCSPCGVVFKGDIKRLSNGPARPEWGRGRHRSCVRGQVTPHRHSLHYLLKTFVDNLNLDVYIVPSLAKHSAGPGCISPHIDA